MSTIMEYLVYKISRPLRIPQQCVQPCDSRPVTNKIFPGAFGMYYI